MILTRTPLRISIAGGGTDLPSYYRRSGGTVISAAINKYVYLAVNRTFTHDYLLKYADARAGGQGRRDRARAHPRDPPALRGRARDRDRERGRHPLGHGPGVVRLVHRRACCGPCTPTPASHVSTQAPGRGRLPHRDRAARRSGRQAGPVHRRLRRPDPLRVPRRTTRCTVERAVGRRRRRWPTSRSTCCCSSPATPGGPPPSWPTRSSAPSSDDEAMIANLDDVRTSDGASRAALEAGDTARLRRADARALAGQAAAHRRASPATRSTAGTNWPVATARWAASSSAPAPAASCSSTPTSPRQVRAGHGRRRACRRSGSGSTTTAPSSWPAVDRRSPASSSAAAWAPGCDRATDAVPKPLLPVAGRAVRRSTSSRWLVAEGVTDVVYSIGHLGRSDPRRRSAAARSGLLAYDFVDEGPSLLGTGGAVRLAVDAGRSSATTSSSSTATPTSTSISAAVAAAFGASGSEALMTVFRNDGEWEREQRGLRATVGSCATTSSRPTRRAAGMHHIDYGLSVLSARHGASADPEWDRRRPGRSLPRPERRGPAGRVRGDRPLLRDRDAQQGWPSSRRTSPAARGDTTTPWRRRSRISCCSCPTTTSPIPSSRS